jgi:cell division GTPase FtsZ
MNDTLTEKFQLLQDFGNVTIYMYDPKNFLKTIKEKAVSIFFNFSDNITDKHFSNVSEEIKTFEVYNAKAYLKNENLNFDDVLSFMKENGASLIGVQGLMLLWKRKKDYFERGYDFVSLDEKKGMWSYLENKYATAVLKHRKSGYIFDAEIESVDKIIVNKQTAFLVFKKNGR